MRQLQTTTTLRWTVGGRVGSERGEGTSVAVSLKGTLIVATHSSFIEYIFTGNCKQP